MSRIGNNPIPVPASAKVEISEDLIRVTGPKGELTAPIPPGITAELDGGA